MSSVFRNRSVKYNLITDQVQTQQSNGDGIPWLILQEKPCWAVCTPTHLGRHPMYAVGEDASAHRVSAVRKRGLMVKVSPVSFKLRKLGQI